MGINHSGGVNAMEGVPQSDIPKRAFELLALGHMMRRVTWPEDTFIFMQVSSVINPHVVPKMTSLPEKVREEFLRRFDQGVINPVVEGPGLFYTGWVAMVNSENTLSSWSPTTEDLYSVEWVEYVPEQ